jgi:hypothetical protein
MTDSGLPDCIYAGAPKAASTWLYECVADHPEVVTHEDDSLHYFDIKEHRGTQWYRDAFPDAAADQVIWEASPSYLFTAETPARIAELLPDVTLMFCLRNPVLRAFSNWWHGYSSNYWSYEFEETLAEFPPYQICVEPGFYASHLDRFEEHFDPEQLHVLFFDDLVADDAAFLADVFDILGVDASYKPAPLGEKSNTARTEAPAIYQRGVNWMRENVSDDLNAKLRPVWEQFRWFIEDKSAYDEGMDPEMRAQLEQTYAPDVRRLETKVDRDLGHWFEHVSL